MRLPLLALAASAMALAAPSRVRAGDDPAAAAERPRRPPARVCLRLARDTGRVRGWFAMYRPTCHQLELGLWLGALAPASNHPLVEDGREHEALAPVGGFYGVHGTYLPLPVLGVTLSSGFAPTETRDTGRHTMLFRTSAHAVVQAPTRLSPFGVIGVALLSASGPTVGAALAPALHVGGGLKLYVTDALALRLEARDSVSASGVGGGLAHSVEVMAGLTFVIARLGRERAADSRTRRDDEAPERARLEQPDEDAHLLDVHGSTPTRDDDDALLEVDAPPEPEARAETEAAETETEPNQERESPSGDAAGSSARGDRTAVDAPPGDVDFDALPTPASAAATGLQMLSFPVGRDVPPSQIDALLDPIVTLLQTSPELKLEITGHADATGSAAVNAALSLRRADAVRDALRRRGVAARRLSTRGAGASRPIASNDTAEGRARNRRIELRFYVDS